MTFEEDIRSHFDALHGGCDPAVDKDPRKFALAWYTEGAFHGVKRGVQIGQQCISDEVKNAWEATWNAGYAQGLHYAAYNVSNVRISEQHNGDAQFGAELMRERIVDMLEAAAKADATRVEAAAARFFARPPEE